MSEDQMKLISDFLHRYGREWKEEARNKLISFITQLWGKFSAAKLADSHFIAEFTSGNKQKLVERYWEMLLGVRLLEAGLKPESKNEGPDFMLRTDDGGPIWIEAVCPTAGDGKNRIPGYGDDNWSKDKHGRPVVRQVPNEQINLRWTAAIKEKIDKRKKYIDDKKIDENDRYVIAVNSGNLGNLTDGFYGISQYPRALEVVFALGCQKFTISRETGDIVHRSVDYLPNIPNANNACVPTDSFLDKEYKGISGILACHSHPFFSNTCGSGPIVGEYIYVINPNAFSPINRGILPVDLDYWIETSVEDGNFSIRKIRNTRESGDTIPI